MTMTRTDGQGSKEELADMDRIWIVMGSTGEYSDRNEWPVAAFASEEDAQARVIALDVRMQQMPPEWRDDRWDYQDEIRVHMQALSRNFNMDYTGTSYSYFEVPFESA